MNRVLLALCLSLSALSFAQGTEGPGADPGAAAPKADSDTPEAKEAKELVTKYLSAVKAKKWADAKKFIHPRTLSSIAERKKRLGAENHAMAPWAAEKTEYYLTAFVVSGARSGPLGTIVVETTEDNFQVDVKGVAEKDPASYLVGKVGGKWVVVDKKRNETFPNDAIKLGYKGYFDEVKKTEAPAE